MRLWKDGISNNFFFEYDFFGSMWREILKWLGVHSVLSINAQIHEFQFCSGYLLSKEVGCCLHAIWVPIVELHEKK